MKMLGGFFFVFDFLVHKVDKFGKPATGWMIFRQFPQGIN
jgi:hypothetical protein